MQKASDSPMPEMRVGRIEQLNEKPADPNRFASHVEVTCGQYGKLRSRIAKLEAELKLKDAAIEKYLPCPDHRDKTGEGCYVCRTESRLALLEGLLKRALTVEHCDMPMCNDTGCYATPDKNGDPEPNQCEWCETYPNSMFRLKADIAAAIEQKGEQG